MNAILPLLYAPFVLFLLNYYDVKIVSGIIFGISIVWLLMLENKQNTSVLFPILSVLFSIFSFFSEVFLFLKAIPLLVSIYFSFFILYSYFQKKSMILLFAEKFSKNTLDEKEKEYIHQSTLFWFLVSLMNVLIHLTFYLEKNVDFWLYYSSIGWYFLFIFAGLLQFLHRHYIFLRREY